MRQLAGLSVIAALSLGRASAAERAVAPIEVSVPLAAPLQAGQGLPSGGLGGGFFGIQPLDWRTPGTPALLAAQLLLPPSAVMNFAPRPSAAETPSSAAALSPAQTQSSALSSSQARQPGAQAQPRNAAPMAGESGLIPIEDLGEGSRLPAASRPQERLTETEAALRAPLSQLRDAPSDSGGESLHALSGRVWDLVSGKSGAFARPNAGRAAFSGVSAQAAASALATPAVPPSAASAPLEPSLSPVPGAPSATPASLALVLMNVVEQKLSLSISPVPRLAPGREARPAKPDDVPAPFVASPAPGANLLSDGARDRALPGAGAADASSNLPEFSWRAEAEMVSFGETGLDAPQAAGPAASVPTATQKVIASDVQPDADPLPRSSASRSTRRAPPPPAKALKELSAVLPYSALLALIGAALLVWPERR